MADSRKARSDEDDLKIAKMRFRDLEANGTLVPLEEIREKLSRGNGYIKKAIGRVCGSSLVHVSVGTPNPDKTDRDEDLERELLKYFPNLRHARVVRNDPSGAESDDELLTRVGAVAAKFLRDSELFQPGGKIALGSGRGVLHTGNALLGLTERSRLRPKGVKLVSLTGSVFGKFKLGQRPYFLDANNHVSLFSSSFEHQPEEQQIRQPLIPDPVDPDRPGPEPEMAAKIRARSPLDPKVWERDPADVAVMGVGSLSDGSHRMVRAANNPDEEHQGLQYFHGELAQLINMMSRDYDSAVAESANHLFYCEAPTDADAPSADQVENISSLIRRINSGMVAIQEGELRRIATIVLVASNKLKAAAVRQFVTTYNVGIACIDAKTASEILGRWPQQAPAQDEEGIPG